MRRKNLAAADVRGCITVRMLALALDMETPVNTDSECVEKVRVR